ncbi:MFS transporter [Massilia sp. W12]|uniref:MFS transporter n=1 Tax=Massilia sp. W12 TaxID=3126507 RepID=UPI0030CD065E
MSKPSATTGQAQETPEQAGSALSVLRHKNFSLYLSARVLGTLAVQMQSVAIGWQVYQMTRNVMDLGYVGLAQFAPFFLLILIAGHAADRYPRRRIIALCFAVQLLCAALLAWFSHAGLRSVTPIFATLFLFGCARAFMMTANQAILINLVPPQHFSRALALSSSSFHVAVIAGPALGGLLYLAGPLTVYLSSAALLLLSCALMLCTRPNAQAAPARAATWSSLLEGIHFVRKRPVVLGAMSLDLFAVLFGGVTALLPAYAHDVLQADSSALGLMRSMPALGAIFTSTLLAWRPITRKVGPTLFAGVALYGVATLVIGLSASLWLALPMLFLLGAGDMVSVYVRHLLVQLETPDAIRGRVSAVNAVFIGASNELGEFESGLTASWFGLLPAIIFGGAATLCVTALWAWRFPALSRMDRFPEPVQNAGH